MGPEGRLFPVQFGPAVLVDGMHRVGFPVHALRPVKNVVCRYVNELKVHLLLKSDQVLDDAHVQRDGKIRLSLRAIDVGEADAVHEHFRVQRAKLLSKVVKTGRVDLEESLSWGKGRPYAGELVS